MEIMKFHLNNIQTCGVNTSLILLKSYENRNSGAGTYYDLQYEL